MAEIEKLVVQLSADVRRYENALNKAMGVTNRQARAIETRFAKMNKKVASSFNLGGSFGRGLLGGAIAGFSASGVQSMLDSATKIRNALIAAGLSGAELSKVYNELFAAAQKNGAPLEGLVTLYSRVSLAQKELGVSSEQIVGLVNTVGKAIRLSGGDAAQASGALLQLSQALGGGKLQAEEYNSLIDGMPGLLQAAAAGIKEAGGSVATLTALVKDGKVSSKAFFDGIQAGASVLDQRLAGAEKTVSSSFVRLQNVMVDTASKFDQSTGASTKLAEYLDGPLTDALREIGKLFTSVANGPIGQFVDFIDQAADTALQAAADLGKATGLAGLGEAFGARPYIGQGRIQERIDAAFAGTSQVKTTPKTSRLGAAPPAPNPVSLANYKVPGDDKKARRERLDEYARETKQIQERIALIEAETKAQAGLNPKFDDFGFVVERARVQQELLNAAKAAGKEITPQLTAEIEALATKYAEATAAQEGLTRAQDDAKQAIENQKDAYRELADIGSGAVKSIADAFADGKLEAKELIPIIMQVIEQMLAMKSIGSIFGNMFSGMTGGGINFFKPGLYSKGGLVTGFADGGAVGPASFSQRPEVLQ